MGVGVNECREAVVLHAYMPHEIWCLQREQKPTLAKDKAVHHRRHTSRALTNINHKGSPLTRRKAARVRERTGVGSGGRGRTHAFRTPVFAM
jgi:hypothetical protein